MHFVSIKCYGFFVSLCGGTSEFAKFEKEKKNERKAIELCKIRNKKRIENSGIPVRDSSKWDLGAMGEGTAGECATF